MPDPATPGASEAHFRALAETATDAIVSADARGHIVFWNRAATRIFGYTEAEALGESLTILMPAHFREAHAQGLARVARGEAPRLAGQVVEIQGLRKDGTVFPVDLSTTSYVLGEERWFTSIIRDATERRRAEAAVREGEARLRLALDAAAMVPWDCPLGADATGPAAAVDALLRTVHPDDRARVAAARDVAVRTGGQFAVEFRAADAEGATDPEAVAWHAVTGRVVHDAAGRAIGLHGVRVDVSERRRQEAARARDARLGLLTTQLPAALWSTDTDLRITFSTGAALAAFGVTPGELAGVMLPDYLGTHDPAAPPLVAVRCALAGQSGDYLSTRGEQTFQTHVEPLRDGGDEITGVLGLSIDITDRRRLEEQLAHQAYHDALTGLANRALFRDRVARALDRRAARLASTLGGHPEAGSPAGSDAGGEPAAPEQGAPEHVAPEHVVAEHVAVLFLDLDDFKAVNDALGHPAGDALLREVAIRLQRATRGSDTVARLGGDEFAVLLGGIVDERSAAVIVRRIELALRTPMRLGPGAARAWRVRASVGVAYAGPGDSVDDVLRNADLAMYAAKAEGKDRHAVFAPSMHAAVVARLELEADLRRAVAQLERPADRAERAFRLVYQPIVDLRTGRVRSVEALLRWTRADGTPVSPADFVPLAEETGLVVPLGRWVLREACARLAAWRRGGGAGAALSVGVNVSGRQLADSSALAGDVAAALAASGLPAGALTLEMTESVLMQRTGDMVERLAALKALGVAIAVDDFGTGYSSLAYLQRFPVDVLKIDKAFVDGVADEAGDRAIARTIVALGRALGLRTVGEGIEHEAQRAALAALGCDAGQGYLFARPLEAAGVAAWLARSRPAAGRRGRPVRDARAGAPSAAGAGSALGRERVGEQALVAGHRREDAALVGE